MSHVVFVSHAGADAPRAAAVAAGLQAAGIEVRFDRAELTLGSRFITFMEEALSTADYCLLLWSHHARAADWVQLEWEAALHRSVSEKRSFLVAGRLEDVSLPALLAPRLRADLYPELQPGLDAIVQIWRDDRHAEVTTRLPVAASVLTRPASPGTERVYVSSNLFGITTPLQVDLAQPAGVCLDEVVQAFELPRVYDHGGRVGVRFDYRLQRGDATLDRSLSLAVQGVRPNAVLGLETTVEPYALSAPAAGALQGATFRSIVSSMRPVAAPVIDIGLLQEAHQALLAAIDRAGLGPD